MFNDIYQRSGQFRPLPLPVGAGPEGAGVVRAAGSGISEMKPGDRVGWLGDHNGGCGTYATHTVLDFHVHWPVPLPSSITFRQAACINQGVAGHALTHTVSPVCAGDTCLVHAVAGGSGMLLGQMARMRAAGSSAPCRPRRSAGWRSSTAQPTRSFCMTASRRRWALTGGRGVDVVYDHVGKPRFQRGMSCLARRGGSCTMEMTAARVPPFDVNSLGRTGSQYVTRPTIFDYIETRDAFLARLAAVVGWASSGRLRLKMDHVYPLERAAEAQIALAGRQTTGKVLLVP